MKMLQKIIDCGSLEICQENFYDGVSFSKVTSLKCSGCNSAIKRIHHRLFFENVTKASCLKKKIKNSIFLRKKYIVDQRLNKDAAL